MKLAGNTVLVTGGATGIGLAIAQRFLAAGSRVVVCGRRADKLAEAQAAHPGLETIVADVAGEADRVALFEEAVKRFPDLNVLVNNAGIQRRGKLTEGVTSWSEHQQEIAINFEAPIHLALLFTPHLAKQARPAIVNVTSGLSFAPMPGAAVYSATKAGMHSFTLSLRKQLAKVGVAVVEIIPPAVNTDLGGVGLHNFGVPLDAFADSVMARVDAGELEVGYDSSETRRKATRDELDAALEVLAGLPI
ncbi:MAG: short-chain dehydrogenase [Cyanobacteria bacterium RYN_339]|nr:short-chain dehydrogenase [Cyanobacteria bacterium RYN_339]